MGETIAVLGFLLLIGFFYALWGPPKMVMGVVEKIETTEPGEVLNPCGPKYTVVPKTILTLRTESGRRYRCALDYELERKSKKPELGEKIYARIARSSAYMVSGGEKKKRRDGTLLFSAYDMVPILKEWE